MIGFAKPQNKISLVSIFDSDFRLVNKITDETKLNLFSKHWETKKKLKPSPEPPGRFKIDVFRGDARGGKSQRYLYNEKAGTIRVLTKTITPEYQMDDLEGFNNLLGLKPTE